MSDDDRRRPTLTEATMELFDRYGWTLLIILPALCALAAWWLA